MPEIQIHNQEGKVIGAVGLPVALEAPVQQTVLWQAVRQYLANQRQGTADTKTRGEVRGGGKKPWAQKHTGRARQGSIRSPLWRKGGVVFGPHPREYRYQMPVQMKRRALLESLKIKAHEKAIIVVDTLEGIEPKTKAFHALLKKFDLSKKVLVVTDRPDSHLVRVSRNIPKVSVRPASDLTCYEVMEHGTLLVTSEGLKQLEGILS